MTRKDYQLIVAVFREALEECKCNDLSPTEMNACRNILYVTISKMVRKLEADNPRFSHSKFLTAIYNP